MILSDVLSELKIVFKGAGEHHHSTVGRLSIECPWCSKDSGKFRYGINIEGLYGTCWSCSWKPLIPTLMEASGEPFHVVKKLLDGLHYVSRENAPVTKGKLKLPSHGPLAPAHRKYLRSRGFCPDHLEQFWGLRGITIHARLSWRILIPIHYRGEIVSWTTRSISDKGTRYINARPNEESVSPKTILAGEDHCRHSIIVVEGPFDMLRIGPGAVSTMGLVVTTAQVERIAKYPVRVVCMDSEPEAQTRATKLCQNLSCFPGQTIRVELSAKDPGSASEKEIKRLRKAFLE